MILIHLIPCTALVILNACLVLALQEVRQRRRQMSLRTSTTTVGQRTDVVTEMPASQYEMHVLVSNVVTEMPASQYEMHVMASNVVLSPARQHGGLTGTSRDASTRSTMMLVIVVGVFLLVEVPLSVLLLLVIVENTFQVDLFSDMTRYTAALFVNCCIAVTFPLNFFVYCAMSERFRHMFCALFSRRTNLSSPRSLAPAPATRRSVRTEVE